MKNSQETLERIKEKIVWEQSLTKEEQNLCEDSVECQMLRIEMARLNFMLEEYFVEKVSPQFSQGLMALIAEVAAKKSSKRPLIPPVATLARLPRKKRALVLSIMVLVFFLIILLSVGA